MAPEKLRRPVVAVLLGTAALALGRVVVQPNVTGDRSLARIAMSGSIRIGYAVEAQPA